MKEANVNSKKICESTDFDRAISLTGYGRFHYEITVTSALCILAAGFQNNLSGYIFPAAQCELNLNSKEVGFLNALFLIGGTCSSFLWGVLADTNGRRKILILTLLSDFLITTTFAVTVSNFAGLAVCRFLNGFLVGAPGSITFSYLAEFHPPQIRAKVVCYSGAFFTSAWLILPIAAYMVLPMKLDVVVQEIFKLNPWRFLLFLLVLPELFATIWLLRLPESPKFLLARGDNHSALEILKKMYSINYNKTREDFPVKYVINSNANCSEKTEEISCQRKMLRELKYAGAQVQSLFQQPLLFLTLLLCSIMFANMFGFFGLGLWLPELFIRFEHFHIDYPNATTSLKELMSVVDHIESGSDCTPKFDLSVFVNTAALGISCLFGNIFSGLLAGKLHLKTLPLVTMLVAGISSLLIYFLHSSLQILIVSCFFLSTVATCNLTLGSIAIELFPTSVSAMAYCLMLCVGRLAAICSNVIFGYFFDDQCEVPIFIVAGMALLGCALCLIIPKNASKLSKKVGQENEKDISISVVGSIKC